LNPPDNESGHSRHRLRWSLQCSAPYPEHEIVVLDIIPEKIEMFNRGESTIVDEEISDRSVKGGKGMLNRRPRKSIGYVTLTEVFFGNSFGENFAFQD